MTRLYFFWGGIFIRHPTSYVRALCALTNLSMSFLSSMSSAPPPRLCASSSLPDRVRFFRFYVPRASVASRGAA